MYALTRSTMTAGTRGGPGLYVLAYARADLESLALVFREGLSVGASAARAARRMSCCSFYEMISDESQ
jgi:hypothetical protein